jgi:hypothetical protein
MQTLRHLFLTVFRTTDWSDLSMVDVVLVAFNTFEALVWFACAAFVLARNHRAHRSWSEFTYGVLFILFGLSDLVECFQISSLLIWAKLVILIPLFVLRQRTRAKYEPRPKLV